MDIGEWWTDKRTPAPKISGTFLYCPHATVERVKVPKKRALQEVVKHCPFKTRSRRKYRRHYIRNHGELPQGVAA